MQWQDFIFSIGNFTLALALLPSLFGKHKPDLKTSILTSITLATFGVAFASLQMWLSTAAVLLSTVLWMILAYQEHQLLRDLKK